jgi:hypothetical protein
MPVALPGTRRTATDDVPPTLLRLLCVAAAVVAASIRVRGVP